MAATRRSAEEWRALIEAWDRSGQGRTEFAAAVGVKPSTLSWWRWKLGSVASAPRSAFLEVVVDKPAAVPTPHQAPEFVVEVDEVRVHVPVGFDAHELRRLLDALC